MGPSASIHELVTGALAELGTPVPDDIIQAVLLRDSRFAGHKLSWAGGYAILRAGGNVIEFFNEQGTVLKTVSIEGERPAAA